MNQERNEEAIGQDPMDLFKTREAANDGVVLPLYSPTGERTTHWIKVLGADSDPFREAELKLKREAVRIGSIGDEAARMAATRDAQNRLLASAVVGWSFERPCTFEEITKFLREAPQIADSIDMMISRRSLFFGKRSIDSIASQSKSSDLT